MDRTLIAGIETESGRHLVSQFAQQSEVSGVCLSDQSSRLSSGFSRLIRTTPESVRLLLETDCVSRVIYCGEASISGWSAQTIESTPCSDTSAVQAWSAACAGKGIPFVFLSSDHLFTSPWVFHEEESESLAETPRAQSIRYQETIVAEREHSLIVRSHICGFSPQSFLTHRLLKEPDSDSAGQLWYATPIYAGRFAKLLSGLMSRQATGIYHLGGGERISHSQLLSRLDERFPRPARFTQTAGQRAVRETTTPLETSLRSSKARRLLNEGLPNISDFLDDVAADLESGDACELAEVRETPTANVA